MGSSLALHPVVPLLAAAVAVAFLPRRAGVVVALAAPGAALALLLGVDRDRDHGVDFFGYRLEVLRLDDLSAPFAYVFVVAAALAMLYGAATMGRGERAIALLYAGCGLGVVLAGDLLTLFVLWELKAVGSALLVAAPGRSRSTSAAMRYLLVHVVGGTLLLAGVLWHLSAGGSLTFELFGSHPSAHLVLVAFLLSAAMPPLHAWLPDAYPEASVAGTVFLSAFTTKAAVYALLRGFPGEEALVVMGIAMALYGVVYAVLENDVRRLLGYHIVSQVGFMITAVGIGTAEAVNGATAHAFAHILYKGLLLMGVGAAIHATGRSKLTEMGGLARAMPAVLVLYMVGALSISGVPIFSGFVSKELVVEAAGLEGRTLAVYLLKLASVGTFLSTALKLPWFGWGGPDRGIECRPVPRTMLAAMGITAAVNVAIGLYPALLYDLMPFPVDYAPFSAAKLVEIGQLLLFTGLAFWLLLRKLGGEPTITLDTDWLYRTTPSRVAVLTTAVGARVESARESVVAGARRLPRVPVIERLGSGAAGDPAPPPAPRVMPTTVLGAVTLLACLLVLGMSLTW
jgi:multicomponent Na+:H+ antiporter subunit D